MFHELLQLDLHAPHDKQAYSIKKNKVIFKLTQQSLSFDSICYDAEDIMAKITYLILTAPKKQVSTHMNTFTLTFNYNLPASNLMLLFRQMLAVKTYKQFKLGHFEIKNGHISDYHKNTPDCNLIDDLDQFEKDINTSVRLDKLWKISKVLEYRELTRENFDAEVGRTNRKFGKRTNQFFILEINDSIRIVIILLPRHELVFSREEQKQIQELYILQKHAANLHRQNISFVTPIAQIIKNYLEQSSTNFFVSCYPQGEKSMEQVFKLPLRMSQPHQEQIRAILQGYNKNTLAELERELERSRVCLKEAECMVRHEEDHIKILTKTYTKLFSRTQNKIDILRQRGINNVYTHIQWLQSQIAEHEEQIRERQIQLKQIHQQMIKDQKHHTFYINKVKNYKQQVQSKVTTPGTGTTPHKSAFSSLHSDKENQVVTEQLLLYYYDPQKEVQKYREKREVEARNILDGCNEKNQFFRVMEDARRKLSAEEMASFERQYYFLINS